MHARTIYKLLTRAEWEAARGEGVYRGSAHDKRDGFIHFSTAAQLGETARKYFTGVPDLVLLAVEVEALIEPITPHPVLLPMGGGTPAQASHDRPLSHGERNRVRGCDLPWEPSRGGDLFPHLYGELPISAVKSVTSIALAEDGTPVVPADLAP